MASSGSSAATSIAGNKPWLTGVLAAAGIIIATLGTLSATGALRAFFGGGTNALKAEGAGGSNALSAEGALGSDLLKARGSGTTPPLSARGERRYMPDDIRRWLEHLERIERTRGELCISQISSAMVDKMGLGSGASLDMAKKILANPDEDPTPPDKEMAESNKKHDIGWADLEADFHSLPPPAECVPIRDKYQQTLDETRAMIDEITGHLENAAENPQAAIEALQRMIGTSSGRIDKNGIETDRLIGDICARYDTPKWFSINGDFGGGTLGKIGF